MVKRKLAALEKVDANLTNLQYKIKRDPPSYLKEFKEQFSQYENQKEIFLQAPSTTLDTGLISFRDLVDFIAHVADCYPTLTSNVAQDWIDILQEHHQAMQPDLREKIVGSLVLLRRKNMLDSSRLINTLFPLLVTTSSKTLRLLLFQKILSDLRTSNSHTKNHRLNKAVQRTLHELVVSDRASVKPLWAVKIVRELWKRQIWTDTKAVEIMKEAALADNIKVVSAAVAFFLGGDQEREALQEESDDEDDNVEIGKIKHQMTINKKSKKKARLLDQAVTAVRKKEKRKGQPHPLNFSAFHLLHDPQTFAEELFRKHLQTSRSKTTLEQKLPILQLVTRLTGLHKLTILSLYSYFLRYLTPRQASVTTFLACLAQATHNLVPPDVLEPLVQKIANEFVSEAAASEVASAGLNAIREICARQPLAMQDTLLQDLVMYRKSKDKGVVMAAKGLLSLYREVGPDMLKRRDRGKEASLGMRNGNLSERRFGEEAAGEIEGLELLEKWKAEQKSGEKKGADGATTGEDPGESDSDGWDIDEADDDSDNDSGGWINVDSDNENSIKLDSSSESEPDSDVDMNDASDAPDKAKPASYATQRILTPADLVKMNELRLEASLAAHLPGHKAGPAAPSATRHNDDPLTATEIEGLARLSRKSTKAEKIALAKAGGRGPDEHKSTQSLRREKKEAEGKSSTNKEKARRKNMFMTLRKAKNKGRRSLVEQGRIMKVHVARSKRGGKRGNIGM